MFNKALLIYLCLPLVTSIIARASSSEPQGTSENTKIPKDAQPIYFDKETYGFKIENPVLSWNIESRGEAAFGGQSIGSGYGFTSEVKDNFITLQMRWPQDQFKNPALFIYDQELKQIGEATDLKPAYTFNQKLIPEAQSSVPAENSGVDAKTPKEGSVAVKWNLKGESGIRRICVFAGDKTYSRLLCSPIVKNNGEIQRTPPSVVINGVAQERKASLDLEMNKEFEVDIVFPSQLLSLHINSKAPQTEIVDLAKTNSETIKMIAFGAPPKDGAFKLLKEKRNWFWLGTIGDLREFFEREFNQNSSSFQVDNPDGLIFEMKTTWKRLPEEKNRIYADADTPKSTYAEMPPLKVYLQEDMKADSSEKSVESVDPAKPEAFVRWNYDSSTKYEYQKRRITAQRSPKKSENPPLPDTFSWEMRRMPNTYASARLGVSLSSNLESGLTADGIATHWFEKGLGDLKFIGPRRWGVSASYFDSLYSSIANSKYQLTNADLLYRFTPGTYNWDETLGLSLSYSNIKYLDAAPVAFTGVGIFWSRSLPQWFDNVYGLPNFLKKPKWVDISATAYVQPMSKNITGSLYQVRATGRIQLTPGSFYEVGWGILTTTFTNSAEEEKGALVAGRAFLGYGVCF